MVCGTLARDLMSELRACATFTAPSWAMPSRRNCSASALAFSAGGKPVSMMASVATISFCVSTHWPLAVSKALLNALTRAVTKLGSLGGAEMVAVAKSINTVRPCSSFLVSLTSRKPCSRMNLSMRERTVSVPEMLLGNSGMGFCSNSSLAS